MCKLIFTVENFEMFVYVMEVMLYLCSFELASWLPSWTREQVTELSDDDEDQKFPSDPSDYLISDSDSD